MGHISFWLRLMILEKNIETLINGGEEVGLKINAEISKYMLLCSHQNIGQNHDIKIKDSSSENVSWFKYLAMAIKSKFDSVGN
jgi:hypothetical protein